MDIVNAFQEDVEAPPKSSRSFLAFITLDTHYEEVRQAAYREMMAVAPTLQRKHLERYTLPEQCKELFSFVQTQVSNLLCVGHDCC